MRQTSQRSHKWCHISQIWGELKRTCLRDNVDFGEKLKFINLFSRKRNKLWKIFAKVWKLSFLLPLLTYVWRVSILSLFEYGRTKLVLYKEQNLHFTMNLILYFLLDIWLNEDVKSCFEYTYIWYYIIEYTYILYYIIANLILYYELLYSATKLCILQSYAGYET